MSEKNIKNLKIKGKKRLETSSIDNIVLKDDIDSSYKINFVKGTEAYYSERYGWTLRKK